MNNPEIPYRGMGTLDNGGMGSPAQFMLDMEIRRAEFATKDRIAVDKKTLPYDEICDKVKEEKNFLESEHTNG